MCSLKQFALNNNKLKEFSPGLMQITSLTVLQLAHNSLVEMPTWIWKLSRLTTLNVEDNPLECPPSKILERGTKAVLAYMQLVDRSRTLHRYKSTSLD
jgi:internalin A